MGFGVHGSLQLKANLLCLQPKVLDGKPVAKGPVSLEKFLAVKASLEQAGFKVKAER